MTGQRLPIDFRAHLREEEDATFTFVVEMSGIPDAETAKRISRWLQEVVRDNAHLLGELDLPPSRQ